MSLCPLGLPEVSTAAHVDKPYGQHVEGGGPCGICRPNLGSAGEEPQSPRSGSEDPPRFPLKGSFKGDIGPYKDYKGLYWKYLGCRSLLGGCLGG